MIHGKECSIHKTSICNCPLGETVDQKYIEEKVRTLREELYFWEEKLSDWHIRLDLN